MWKLPRGNRVRTYSCLISSFALVKFEWVLLLSLQSCPTICNLWIVAHQAPLSMGFSRQEYWSGLPCPSPWDLPNPEIEPLSPASPAFRPFIDPLSHLLPRGNCECMSMRRGQGWNGMSVKPNIHLELLKFLVSKAGAGFWWWNRFGA